MALWEYLGAWASITKLLLHLNWNSTDFSGNNNNGSPLNILWSWGKVWSWSASWNGTNSKIDLLPNILNNTWDWSVRWIIKPSNTTQSFGIVFLQEKLNTTQHSKAIAVDWTTLKYLNSNNTARISTSVVLNTNTFYYFVFNFSSSTWWKMYINWNLVWSDTQVWTSTNPYWVNQTSLFYRNNANYFAWIIDEIICENRIINEQEVKKYYTYSKWLYWIL